MEIRAFITHKKAETFLDCQDRFSINIDTKSMAVSDGMSQSFFQKIWAEILATSFTEKKEWDLCDEHSDSVLNSLCLSWTKKVRSRIEEQKRDGAKKNIIIRNENNLVLGKSAGATLVGVRFNANEWTCNVLGDSCLIEIENSEIKNIYTSQKEDEFNNYPDHYDSNPKKKGKGKAKKVTGKLESNKTLLLVSDPFSDFLNEQKKQGSTKLLVNRLLNIETHEDFEALVEEWRTKGMHNDDSTLVIIQNDCSNAITIKHADKIEELIRLEKNNLQIVPTSILQGNMEKKEVLVIEFFDVFLSDFKSILKNYSHCGLYAKVKYKCVEKAFKKAIENFHKKYIVLKR